MWVAAAGYMQGRFHGSGVLAQASWGACSPSLNDAIVVCGEQCPGHDGGTGSASSRDEAPIGSSARRSAASPTRYCPRRGRRSVERRCTAGPRRAAWLVAGTAQRGGGPRAARRARDISLASILVPQRPASRGTRSTRVASRSRGSARSAGANGDCRRRPARIARLRSQEPCVCRRK